MCKDFSVAGAYYANDGGDIMIMVGERGEFVRNT